MVLLDTHAWLWWLSEPSKLGTAARDVIDSADRIGVATISCWEVAMLAESGRIALDRPIGAWVRQALGDARTTSLPLTCQIAIGAAMLTRQGFVGDPADRIIYSTARDAGVTLVTRDEALRTFDPRGTVW